MNYFSYNSYEDYKLKIKLCLQGVTDGTERFNFLPLKCGIKAEFDNTDSMAANQV